MSEKKQKSDSFWDYYSIGSSDPTPNQSLKLAQVDYEQGSVDWTSIIEGRSDENKQISFHWQHHINSSYKCLDSRGLFYIKSKPSPVYEIKL